jgi:hypothetical protein
MRTTAVCRECHRRFQVPGWHNHPENVSICLPCTHDETWQKQFGIGAANRARRNA